MLPIGGLKEKTMAALRHGVHTVIIPKENDPDLAEIDQTVRASLEFLPVSHADEVLAAALDFSACRSHRAEQPSEPIPELAVPHPKKTVRKSGTLRQ